MELDPREAEVRDFLNALLENNGDNQQRIPPIEPPCIAPPGNEPPGNAPPGNDHLENNEDNQQQIPPIEPPGNAPPGNEPPGNDHLENNEDNQQQLPPIEPPGNAPPGNEPPGNAPPGNDHLENNEDHQPQVPPRIAARLVARLGQIPVLAQDARIAYSVGPLLWIGLLYFASDSYPFNMLPQLLVNIISFFAMFKTNVCLDPVCLKQAGNFMQLLKSDVQPCNDFYQFACENLQTVSGEDEMMDLRSFQNQQLLDIYQEKISDDDHVVVKAAKGLFQSCMNEVGIERDGLNTMKQIVQYVGGWPVVDSDNWNAKKFDWNKTIVRLRKTGVPYSTFLKVSVEVSSISANQPTFEVAAVANDFSPAKKSNMLKLAKLFGAKDDNKIEEAYHEVEELWRSLKEVEPPSYTSGSCTIEQYQKNSPYINWLEFIEQVTFLENVICSKTLVIFPPPDKLRKFMEILLNTPKRVQANYMIWSMVYEMSHLLHRKIRNEMGIEHQPRAEFCMAETEKRFEPSPIRFLADQRYLPVEKMKAAEDFITEVRSEFVELVQNMEWIKELKDLERVINRIKEIKIIVARPENYYSDVVLNIQKLSHGRYYSEQRPPVIGSNTFLSLIAHANIIHDSVVFNQIQNREAAVTGHEYLNSHEITHFGNNHMLFVPSVVIQRYFNEKLPHYYNLGRLGTIMLSFLNNKLEEFAYYEWTGLSRRQYNERVDCIRDEFLHYLKSRIINDAEYEEIKQHIKEPVHCKNYMKQVIAERLAYTLLQNWKKKYIELPLIEQNYSQNQLFWVSVATTTCSNNHHILSKYLNRMQLFVSTAKSDDFIKDFSCSKHSNVYLQYKCKIDM